MTDFATSIERLRNHVRHWERPRWSARTPAGTKADLTYALIQHLADLGADAEDRPRRPVPREADQILPDQLLVVADDLLAATADPAVLAGATAAVHTLRAAL